MRKAEFCMFEIFIIVLYFRVSDFLVSNSINKLHYLAHNTLQRLITFSKDISATLKIGNTN